MWRDYPTALPAAVVFHAGVVAMMSVSVVWFLQLVAFNGLMVVLVWLTTRRPDGTSQTQPSGDRSDGW